MLHPEARDYDSVKTRLTSAIGKLREEEVHQRQLGDFKKAEQAKLKILQLKDDLRNLAQLFSDVKNKENRIETQKRCEHEVQEFRREWDRRLRDQIENAKQQELELSRQQNNELAEFKKKLVEEELPKTKYSSQAISMRRHLETLIKAKEYKEADALRGRLSLVEHEQQEKWKQRHEEKKVLRYKQIVKRQQHEFDVLRMKLEAQFNDKVKERERLYQTLINRNQKRRLEQGKPVSSAHLRTESVTVIKRQHLRNISAAANSVRACSEERLKSKQPMKC